MSAAQSSIEQSIKDCQNTTRNLTIDQVLSHLRAKEQGYFALSLVPGNGPAYNIKMNTIRALLREIEDMR